MPWSAALSSTLPGRRVRTNVNSRLDSDRARVAGVSTSTEPAYRAQRSQGGALVLLVALHDVVAAGRRRNVLLALKVPVDPVPPDPHPARVLERLQVAPDAIPLGGEA